MSGPRCCGEVMVQWQHTLEETGRRGPGGHRRWLVWHCMKCDKERELYPKPWRWLWVRIRREDLDDQVIKPAPWLGFVGSMRWFDGTMLFTVIPFNRVVDGITAVYNWIRYSYGDKYVRELWVYYRRGKRDGEKVARCVIRDRLNAVIERMKQDGRPETRDFAVDLFEQLGRAVFR